MNVPMMAKKQWHKLLNYFSSLSNFFWTTTSRCMEDGFLFCLGASSVSTRPLDREPLPWQSPQHNREPPQHTESSRHPSHCVNSRKYGMVRDGHKWKWRTHSTEKKAATRHHAEMCFKATTEKTQSMRRALLSLTAFYKKECVDYIILF